ncbi:unnamed protein product [Musa acuminata subsp. burmannicoides]
MGLKCKRDKKVTVVDHSWVGHVIEYSLEHFEWFNTLDIKRKNPPNNTGPLVLYVLTNDADRSFFRLSKLFI